MTAHHPSTAALLNPAHATLRENACVVTGGVLDELTPSERAAFVALVERLADGAFTWISFDRDPNHKPPAATVAKENFRGGGVTTLSTYKPAARSGVAS